MDLGTFWLFGNYAETNILQKGHKLFNNIVQKGEETTRITFSNKVKYQIIIQYKCVLKELQVLGVKQVKL